MYSLDSSKHGTTLLSNALSRFPIVLCGRAEEIAEIRI